MNSEHQRNSKDYVAELRRWLREFDPDLPILELVFYASKDSRDIGPITAVSSQDIRREAELKTYLQGLLDEGRDWVNLSGRGKLEGHRYLIAVEYSDNIGAQRTAVACSGPVIHPDGTNREYATELIE